MATTAGTQDKGKGWRASGNRVGNRVLGSSGGVASSRQRGQSTPMEPSFTEPSSVDTTNLIPLALEQTTSMALGLNSGDATAAPRQNANHASTHQRNRVVDLSVFMKGLDK